MSYIGYDGPDAVSKAMLDKLAETTSQYSALTLKLQAADGDKESAIKSWMETTDMTQAVKLRTTVQNALAKLRELAESNVELVTLTEDDKTKLTVELDELKSQIKAGYQVLDNIVENFSPDKENVTKALESIENPVKSNRGRKPGTPGSGLPRVSAVLYMIGGNFENEQVYDSFSKAAMTLNCDVKDMQVAFAEAAGVTHENIKSAFDKSGTVEFDFQPNSNGAVYHFRAVQKDRKKPGPRTSDSTPEQATEPQQEASENAA